MSELIPHGQEWADMKNMAQVFVRSGLLPNTVNTPEKALVIMMQGRELGIPPMQAFSKISVIQGKPTLGAELQLSLVRNRYPNAKIIFKAMTKKECVIQAARPGDESQEFSFTWDDAVAMNLTGKDNWKKMPKNMLKWRCVSDMCRTLFPECLSGASYTPEELNPDLIVNESGDVVEKTTESTPKTPEPPKKEEIIIDAEVEVTQTNLEDMDADQVYTGSKEQKTLLMKLFLDHGVSTAEMKSCEKHIKDNNMTMAQAEAYLRGGE